MHILLHAYTCKRKNLKILYKLRHGGPHSSTWKGEAGGLAVQASKGYYEILFQKQIQKFKRYDTLGTYLCWALIPDLFSICGYISIGKYRNLTGRSKQRALGPNAKTTQGHSLSSELNRNTWGIEFLLFYKRNSLYVSFKNRAKMGMVVHSCNLSTWEAEFEATLGYI